MLIFIILLIIIIPFLLAFDFASQVIMDHFNITFDPIADVIIYVILAAILFILPFVLLKLPFVEKKFSEKAGILCGITWLIEIIAVSLWLFFPANMSYINTNEVYSMTIEKSLYYGTEDEKTVKKVTTTDLGLIEELLVELNEVDYNHATKRDMEAKRKSPTWEIRMKNQWGEEIQYICIYSPKNITVSEGENQKYANFTKKYDYTKLDILTGNIESGILSEAATEAFSQWGDFRKELFDSFNVDKENKSWSFTIPKNLPGSDYELKVSMVGKTDYKSGEFIPHKLTCLKEQQENQNWIPGETYTVRFGDAVIQHLWITVKVDGYIFDKDMVEFLPEENQYR
ncbi:MAG: hypothetical protein E7388_01875 [Ruminococcaceae bacterium]|nr:hypothetical protein [Oscillospiraceae bacterium]